MNKINLERYADFTYELASNNSKDLESFIENLRYLDSISDVNIPLLIASGIGLASEGGELNEIIKKMLFQGKPLNEDNIFHMKRELGDVIWYWINACNALGMDPNEVIEENVNKLISRYPGGNFDVHYSENRKENDL
jgi:NTP pyrophosphatase (non-canonical NTP hydrolase)